MKSLLNVSKIVIHASGFEAGNVELFRLYHILINGWCDIGYHFVIGNGKGDYSFEGQVERGRSLKFQGAHVKGQNHDSIGICLIMAKGQTPTELQLLALENLVFYLCRLYDLDSSSITTHSQLSSKWDPGPNFKLEIFRERIKSKLKDNILWPKITLNLRKILVQRSHPFGYYLKLFKKAGVTRLVFPLHWNVEEKLDKVRNFVVLSKNEGFETALYTGPFGTEKPDILRQNPWMRAWQQRSKDGKPLTYRGLLFFCPNSPYLQEYRGPIIESILERCPFDWVFFDIPWFLKGGCYCKYCLSERNAGKKSFKQKSLRVALANFVLRLKTRFPHLKFAVNTGCNIIMKHLAWNCVTPEVFSGIFEEMVTEYNTPSGKEKEISKCLKIVNERIGGVSLSHAFFIESNGKFDYDKLIKIAKIAFSHNAGIWITPPYFDERTSSIFKNFLLNT